MRVFVTGATGYIGFAVGRALKAHGHHVVGLARTDVAGQRLEAAGIEALAGDLEAGDVLRHGVQLTQAVVHCGFARGARAVEIESAALDAMLGAAGDEQQAFIYTSGVWVYGSRGDAVVAEDAPLTPLALVAWRPSHEARVLAAASQNVRTSVIRPGIVYGDGGGMIGSLVEQARAGGIQIAGDGSNRWSCVRVDALAELYVVALERAARGSIYNATLGAPVPYIEIARAASRAAGGDGTVEHLPIDAARARMGPFADALAADLQVSSERARRELGWEPHRPTILEELSATTVV